MKRHALIIDISCDVNGGVETCKATTHEDPVYEVDGITHYCVDNIPGAVPFTSSQYLAAQSFPYILDLANNPSNLTRNPVIKNAILTKDGTLTNRIVAEKYGFKLSELD